ncbi:hypothetical protein GR28A_00023 [Vibrio phage vB_VcorM_GR28A]|nr:hypothetical protein GR28A_00023 [Vibrio phage vB_VcorM_GR28A]
MPMPLKGATTDKSNWYFTEEDAKKVIELLTEWRPRRLKAREQGDLSLAPIPDFVGLKVWDIAKNVAKAPCYSSYSYREDMVLEAMEYVLKYLHNFDPTHVGERSGRVNFCSYVTRIVDRRYGRILSKEEEQRYYKDKAFIEMGGYAAVEGELNDIPELLNNIDNTEMGRDVYARVAKYEAKREEERVRDREKRKARREETKEPETKPKKPKNGLARLMESKKNG